MNNALRDQLLKAGLVTEQQVKKADEKRTTPRKGKKPAGKPARKQAPQARAKKPNPEMDLASAYAARNQQERREREAAERAKREAAARKKAIKNEIRDLVRKHQVNNPEADTPYNFLVGDKIKRVYVTPEQNTALARGELTIVFQDGKRCLIPAATAAKIHELDPERIIIRNTPEDANEQKDDPYAGYEVPDDLMW